MCLTVAVACILALPNVISTQQNCFPEIHLVLDIPIDTISQYVNDTKASTNDAIEFVANSGKSGTVWKSIHFA